MQDLSKMFLNIELVTVKLELVLLSFYISTMMKMDKFDIFRMTFICCFGLPDTAVSLFSLIRHSTHKNTKLIPR